MAGAIEKIFSSMYHKIIAEKYYSRRFLDALPILNYPNVKFFSNSTAFDPDSYKLLYTGGVSTDRGALNLARLVADFADISVTTAGYCPSSMASRMRQEAHNNGSERLHIIGENSYLPFNEIVSVYKKRCWLAGMALFPYTDHYKEKELTKFFEYMSVGLPIIATDFPVWRELIEKQGVGLCVNPNDTSAVKEAIDCLRSHPDKAKEMSIKGKKLVENKYNWQNEAQKLMKFYANIQK